MLRPLTKYQMDKAVSIALLSIQAYNKEFTMRSDYILMPSPKPGTCFGCVLYENRMPSSACHGSGCMPSENPTGTHRVVQAIHAAPALARATDPATSVAAAAKVPTVTLRQAIVAALTAERTLTGKEIAAYSGKPLNSITPRFKGLVDSGIIRDTGLIRDGQTVWTLW